MLWDNVCDRDGQDPNATLPVCEHESHYRERIQYYDRLIVTGPRQAIVYFQRQKATYDGYLDFVLNSRAAAAVINESEIPW